MWKVPLNWGGPRRRERWRGALHPGPEGGGGRRQPGEEEKDAFGLSPSDAGVFRRAPVTRQTFKSVALMRSNVFEKNATSDLNYTAAAWFSGKHAENDLFIGNYNLLKVQGGI